MTLEQLKQSWVSNSKPEVQARLWDRASADYKNKPLPDPEKDPFLKRLQEEVPLHEGIRTLDVGCGAGGYSLALAPFVTEAVGVDISGGMIEIARARGKELGIANAAFSVLNWSEADIDALGFRNRFQVVFAHMTPAVCDYATLEKMDACAARLCMLQKPTRRRDSVLDRALELVGILPEAADQAMVRTYNYLWEKGYEPHFVYDREIWHTERVTEDMVGWCTDRAKLRNELTPAEEAEIACFVRSLSENGIVSECTTTTRVTTIWKKEI